MSVSALKAHLAVAAGQIVSGPRPKPKLAAAPKARCAATGQTCEHGAMLAGNTGASSPRRVLVKLSGEMLGGETGVGVCAESLRRIAADVIAASADGVELAVVVGGGNLVRGTALQRTGMGRISADHMGMLATTMNALALQDALEAQGQSRGGVHGPRHRHRDGGLLGRQSARGAGDRRGHAAGRRHRQSALHHRHRRPACGPLKVGASLVVKGTKVDGVYTADPVVDPTANRYETLTFAELLARRPDRDRSHPPRHCASNTGCRWWCATSPRLAR